MSLRLPVVKLAAQTYDRLPMPSAPRSRALLQPPQSSAAVVVVCERTPRWSIVARQWLPGIRLVDVRTLEDVLPMLQQASHSVLLLDVESRQAPQTISLLVRIQTELPDVMGIACVANASSAWELLLREAGAALVLRSPRRLPQIAPWLLRHLASAPQQKLSPQERLWGQLPWPEAASATRP